MPRVIEGDDAPACELGECIEELSESGFRPHKEDSLLHAAGWLRRLGDNRTFLGDLILEQLRNRHREQEELSSYGPQVIMLSRPGGEFFLRANIWPSEGEHAYRASGGDVFVYGLAHDHNFDFLTVGYFGPGYWSDYYTYDYEALDGWVGEKANLRFAERSALSEGRLLHYRAHLDVHRQWPPDSLSVSLNVMHMGAAQGWFDQYLFDVDSDTVTGIAAAGASETFLRVAVGLGSSEALDLAERFGRTHPSDRMRLAAWEARAAVMPDQAARDALWREAELAGSRMVAMEARRRRAALAA
jgi:hypothetical protein